MMNLTSTIVFAFHLQSNHFGELAGKRITNNAYYTHCATRNHGERQCVVTGDNIEVAWLVLDDFVNLLQIA